MKIEKTFAKTLKPKPDPTTLGFGQVFTDHMFVMDYSLEMGWSDPRIIPYQSFSMDPATTVLHYGQAVFEGLKAYHTASGSIQLFRPELHFKRLNQSCGFLCIPNIDEEFVLEALKTLLALEKEWVPEAEATSLYIRPTIIATDTSLGVKVSKTYRFFIILSPVGPYYPEGFKPTKLLVEATHVRAVPGGLGEAKTPANYAASLFSAKRAWESGFSQVIWLDGREHKWVEECGSMNIFFVQGEEIVTPPLQGSILAGVTRDSILHLGKMWGLNMIERPIAIDEVIESASSGRLKEIFGSGTAAVISPVKEIVYEQKNFVIGSGSTGPIAARFYQNLTDIQYGKVPAPKNWVSGVPS